MKKMKYIALLLIMISTGCQTPQRENKLPDKKQKNPEVLFPQYLSHADIVLYNRHNRWVKIKDKEDISKIVKTFDFNSPTHKYTCFGSHKTTGSRPEGSFAFLQNGEMIAYLYQYNLFFEILLNDDSGLLFGLELDFKTIDGLQCVNSPEKYDTLLEYLNKKYFKGADLHIPKDGFKMPPGFNRSALKWKSGPEEQLDQLIKYVKEADKEIHSKHPYGDFSDVIANLPDTPEGVFQKAFWKAFKSGKTAEMKRLYHFTDTPKLVQKEILSQWENKFGEHLTLLRVEAIPKERNWSKMPYELQGKSYFYDYPAEKQAVVYTIDDKRHGTKITLPLALFNGSYKIIGLKEK